MALNIFLGGPVTTSSAIGANPSFTGTISGPNGAFSGFVTAGTTITAGTGLTVTTGTLTMGTSQAINATTSLLQKIGGVTSVTYTAQTTTLNGTSSTEPTFVIDGSPFTSGRKWTIADVTGVLTFTDVTDSSIVPLQVDILGIGVGNGPQANLDIGLNLSRPAWTTNGIQARFRAASYTDTSSSGTVATQTVNSFGIPTLLASSATTYTDAATVYIAGPPTASTNVTITNNSALLSAGDIKILTAGQNFFRSYALNNNGVAGLLIQTGNGGSTQLWQISVNNSGTNGEFSIKDNTNSTTVLTIPKASGQFQVVVGSASVPTYSFAGQTSYGVSYISGLALVANGAVGLTIDSARTSTFAGLISSSKTSGTVMSAGSATTGQLAASFTNTSGDLHYGIESSVGGNIFAGSSAYATVFGSLTAVPVQLFTNNTLAASISTAQAWRMPAYGAGAATFDASGNITSVSDKRYKKIQGKFTDGLSAIQKITPQLYKWNELSGCETDGTYAGFIAQDVQAASEWATGVDSRGYLTLQDRAILAMLVNAVKELATRL